MAGTKRNILIFEDITSKGVFEAPIDAVIFIESTKELFIKVSNTGLTSASTIADGIALGLSNAWPSTPVDPNNAPSIPTPIGLIPPTNVWSKYKQGQLTNLDAALLRGYKLLPVSVLPPVDSQGNDKDIWLQRDE